MKTTNLKKVCLFVVSYLVLIAITATTAYCQFGSAPDQRTAESFPLYQITQIPLLRTDMSLDCMVAYIAMDSVTRNIDYKNVLDFIFNTSIDTLKVLSRYMYAVDEYDPTLLRSYIYTLRDSLPGSTNYKSLPQNSYSGVKQAIINKIDELGRDYSMLLLSNYILKVRIDSVVIGTDTTFNDNLSWVNVACTVLDTIKATYLPDNCNFGNHKFDKHHNEINTSGNNCLIFGYPQNWRTGNWLRKAGLLDTDTYIRTVQKDEEYFVFLEFFALSDSTDYLTSIKNLDACGGLFRINNGIVEDTGNYWGLGTTPNVNDFQNHLLTLIGNIKTWWVQ